MLSVGIAWQNFQTLRLWGLIELLPRRFGKEIPLANYKELVPLKILRGIDWGGPPPTGLLGLQRPLCPERLPDQ